MVPVQPTLTSTAGFVSTFDRLGLLLASVRYAYKVEACVEGISRSNNLNRSPNVNNC